MIRFLRFLGCILIGLGALVTISWFFEPLRAIWPHLIDAFHALPVAVQIGLIIAAVGFTILFSSIVWERLEDWKREKNLLDEE